MPPPKGLSLEGFYADAAAKLLEYDFPGNARELRYLVERAAMLCRSGRIRAEHLALPAKTGPAVAARIGRGAGADAVSCALGRSPLELPPRRPAAGPSLLDAPLPNAEARHHEADVLGRPAGLQNNFARLRATP